MLRARKTRAIVHVLCSPEKQKKNRARSLSLLHLPPKDGSETGADQGAYMDKDSPPLACRPDLSLFSGCQFRVSSAVATSAQDLRFSRQAAMRWGEMAGGEQEEIESRFRLGDL